MFLSDELSHEVLASLLITLAEILTLFFQQSFLRIKLIELILDFLIWQLLFEAHSLGYFLDFRSGQLPDSILIVTRALEAVIIIGLSWSLFLTSGG